MSKYEEIADEIWDYYGFEVDELSKNEFIKKLKKLIEPIKTEIHYCIIDCGDGSYYPALFKTAEGCEAREEYELEANGYSIESTGSKNLEIDLDGKILNRLDYVSCDRKSYEEIYED